MSAAHQLIHSSKTDEWFTPSTYVEAARATMGSIDLDPASTGYGNTIILADTYYSQYDNGLSKRWHGNVWLNPPYGRCKGKSNQALWSEYLLRQHTCGNVAQAVLLVNAVPGERWFQALWRYPICFTDHRIRFLRADGTPRTSPTHANAFVYLGDAVGKFITHFGQFGTVAVRLGGRKPTTFR